MDSSTLSTRIGRPRAVALVPLAEARELALGRQRFSAVANPWARCTGLRPPGSARCARDYVTTTVDVQVVRNEVETATTTTCHMTVKFPGRSSEAVRISLTA